MTRPEKNDIDALTNSLLPFAKEMLQGHKEFIPFGGHMKPDGQIVWEGVTDGREPGPSQDLIDMLRAAHRDMVKDGAIKACATVYDVRITPPGRDKQDAIAVALDHQVAIPSWRSSPIPSTRRAGWWSSHPWPPRVKAPCSGDERLFSGPGDVALLNRQPATH